MAETPSFYVYGTNGRLQAVKDDPRPLAAESISLSDQVAEAVRLSSPEPMVKVDNTALKQALRKRREKRV